MQRKYAAQMAGSRGLLVLCLTNMVLCAYVPPPPPTVRILSPRKFQVLHDGDVDVVYRVEGHIAGSAEAVLLVNGTEALRTRTTQPSVMLSGLPPGICELSVQLVYEHHNGKISMPKASTLFLISSAAADEGEPPGWNIPLESPGSEGRAGHQWLAVAVASDDWGRTSDMIPVFPDLSSLRQAEAEGWDPGSWGRATVETAGDVERLFDIVEGLNRGAPAHQQVVISPYWVVGGPAYDKMAARGCPSGPECRYEERMYHNSSGPTAAWPYCRGDLRELYRSGFEHKLWHPQFHGRSHFDVKAWVHYLADDAAAQRFFGRGMAFCNDTSMDTNGHPRTLLSEFVREHEIPGVSELDRGAVSAWLAEGLQSFRAFWGFSPIVVSFPHHATAGPLGEMLWEQGFIALDNTDLGPPLLTTLRVGFEPCCIPLSVARARALIDMTVAEEDGHINIQSHAQNFHSSTATEREHMERVREFVELVLWTRRRHPRLVFVTVSELMQLKGAGWSREVWADHLVYRNHFPSPAEVALASRASVSRAEEEEMPGDAAGDEEVVFVREVLYGGAMEEGDGGEVCKVAVVGSSLELLPGRMYVVRHAGFLPRGAELQSESCAAFRRGRRSEEAEAGGSGAVQEGAEGAEGALRVSPRVLRVGMVEEVRVEGAAVGEGAGVECTFRSASGEGLGSAAAERRGDGGDAKRGFDVFGDARGGEGAGKGVWCRCPRVGSESVVRVEVRRDGAWVGAAEVLFVPPGMAQRQPQRMGPPRIALDDELLPMLMHKDVEMTLRPGLRLCLYCGHDTLPGFLNLSPARPRDEAAEDAKQLLPPLPESIAWDMSLGLGFLAEGAVSGIVLGRELRVDWAEEGAVARLEALLDECWRVLERGGSVRVLRPLHAFREEATSGGDGGEGEEEARGEEACGGEVGGEGRGAGKVTGQAGAGEGGSCGRGGAGMECGGNAGVRWPPWEPSRLRCAGRGSPPGRHTGCRGNIDDSQAILDLLEAVGLLEVGAETEEERGTMHTYWPTPGAGSLDVHVFTAAKP